jgi:hypothetical protein
MVVVMHSVLGPVVSLQGCCVDTAAVHNRLCKATCSMASKCQAVRLSHDKCCVFPAIGRSYTENA